jgi:2-polyprenyl-3-methyl-5-hydroxy-6-metoxy-1,4-benzoquinol methylase
MNNAVNFFARETPDIETSSEGYAQRFSGPVGAYLLGVQDNSIRSLLNLSAGSTVLDVGGGHGQLIPLLTEQGYKVTITGSSNECYRRLQTDTNQAGITLVTGDLLDLPFPDRSFDLVISVRLVSHIKDWPRLIREFCRIARTSIIIDYPRPVGFNALTPLLFRIKRKLEKNTRTYTNFTEKELACVFGPASFHITGVTPQFFLPMVTHRVLASPAWLRGIERLCAGVGLTRMFGSPAVLRADRSPQESAG